MEEIARRENELQQKYNNAMDEIKKMKSRFSRARGISPLERLSIAVSICDLEEIAISTGKDMRLLWFMRNAHMLNARYSRPNPNGATHTDCPTTDIADSS